MRLVPRPLGPLLADHPRVLTEATAGGGEAKRTFTAMMGMGITDVAKIEAARRQ